MSVNDLLAPAYEYFFDWNIYQTLLNCIYENNDYGKIGWLLFLVPLILLILFYKIWDPVSKQRLWGFITIVLIMVIGYSATTGFLYNNGCMLTEIDAFGGNGVDPEYFIFQISMITVLYSFVASMIYSFIVKRFSKQNSHNPF